MSAGQRADLWLLTVTVDGQRLDGNWDKKTGGNVDSEETTYRPGGSPTKTSLGGPIATDNVTVTRLFIRERDLALYRSLVAKCGKANGTIMQQPLDENYTPWGTPITWTGRLKKCTCPEVDSNSQGPSLMELEFSVTGLPS